MVLQPDCPYVSSILPRVTTPQQSTSDADSPQARLLCPTADELKYRFVRVTVDCIDLYLVEAGSALNVQVSVLFSQFSVLYL